MINANFALSDGPHLTKGDVSFTIRRAGVLKGNPSQKQIRDTAVEDAILDEIRQKMPRTISISKIQQRLG